MDMKTSAPKPIVLAVVIAACVAAWVSSQSGLFTPDATAQPPKTSTSKSAAADALAKDCRTKAAALRKQLDKDFLILVQPPFVIAGDMDAQTLANHAKWSIHRPAKAMWSSYFKSQPDQAITVLFLSDEGMKPYGEDKEPGFVYRHWARKLFNDSDLSPYGYYMPSSQTMVMNIDTGGGTLVHELTHALIVYDFPAVSDWFNEGLGSLHEQCTVNENEVVGLENWRLPALQKAITAGKLRSLKDLVTRDDFRGRLEGMNYAQARYFVMYMQSKGLLKDFYARYRDNHEGDAAAVKAIEKVFGKKIDEIEKGFVAYVKTLHFPPRP